MMTFLNFILFSAIFWMVFRSVLKRETFFGANRFYLLFVPLLAAVLPFMRFEFLNLSTKTEGMIPLPEISLFGQERVAEYASEGTQAITVGSLLIGIYILGILISSYLFVKKIYQLRKLKAQGITKTFRGAQLVRLTDSREAFTFLKTVYIGDRFDKEQERRILKHEFEHVRQKHYRDLMYFEILRIFTWFNPFVYLLQLELVEVHEYAVDRKITRNRSKRAYVENLLCVSLDSPRFSLTNSFFNQKTLKTRVIMLYKKSSNRLFKLKYLLILPLLFSMVLYVSCTEDRAYQLEESETSSGYDSPKSKTKTARDFESGDKVPFQAVETSPEFPDSPVYESEEERKEDFIHNMTTFVNTNFDVENMRQYAEEGINRIAVQFMIDEEGKIGEIKIRSPQPEIEEEIRRILNVLPQMKPAKMNGKPVRTIYMLPIVFQNDKNKQKEG